MNHKQAATAILDSPLLEQILDDYIKQSISVWIGTRDQEGQHDQWSKVNTTVELGTYIQNKCKEIVSGS